jgi:hypothetical protein
MLEKSLLVVASYPFDSTSIYPNKIWSNLGGILLEELNVLESEFLFLLEFSVVITREEYTIYEEEISKKALLSAFLNEPEPYLIQTDFLSSKIVK